MSWRSEKSEVQNFPDHAPEPDFFCSDAYGMVVIQFYAGEYPEWLFR
ncbi:hypothetical protein [Proteus mirabilis]|nr:hypothetical protein [Proteus mirabilis]